MVVTDDWICKFQANLKLFLALKMTNMKMSYEYKIMFNKLQVSEVTDKEEKMMKL
jgi:hypothetical protein